jgi:copper transport protein
VVSRRLLVSCLTLLALLGALPASAHAHASLSTADPADGETVDAPPAQVELRFTGAVKIESTNAVTVFAPDGSTVQRGTARASKGGTVVTQQIEAATSGTYAIAWRVTSEDGHTLTDSLTFHVGEKSSGTAKSLELSREQASVNDGLQLAAGVARGLEIAGLLALVGGGIFAAVIAPAWGMRFAWPATLMFLAGLVLAYVVDAAISHDVSLATAMTPKHIAREASTPYGSALLVTAAASMLALPVVFVLRTGRMVSAASRWVSVAMLCALAGTLSLAGHATTADQAFVRVPLDMLHVIAAAVWMGGLLQLWALAPHLEHHPQALRRFAGIAFACVVSLLATGIYATIVELDRDISALLNTAYGRIILAKLVLYAGALPLAWLNKSTYVPAIERRPDAAAHLLRQYVAREFALVLAVVALTAWLIGTDQPA